KVAVNHPRAKNLIGAFHQPVGVWIDTAVLGTLPDREYVSGLAEVVKYGVILDPELFAYLEGRADEVRERQPETVGHLVARSCRGGRRRTPSSRCWRRCAATRRRCTAGSGSCCRGGWARWRCSTTCRRPWCGGCWRSSLADPGTCPCPRRCRPSRPPFRAR